MHLELGNDLCPFALLLDGHDLHQRLRRDNDGSSMNRILPA